MKRLLFISTVFAVFFCLFLSGCGRKKREKGEVKLLYLDVAWPEYDELRRQQVREFEKLHPGVKCTYLPMPHSHLAQKLQAMFEGKVSPDIFVILGGVPEAVLKGHLLNLTPYVESNWDYFKEFNPKALKRHYGRNYSIPVNLGTVSLFYNKRLFDEEGVSYPDENWDWNDFREAAVKLTRRDKSGRVTQWGASIMALWWQFAMQNGAAIWNEDRTECVFDSPEAAEAFRFFKELFSEYRITPSPEPANKERFRKDFFGGKAAMFIGDRWRSKEFKLENCPVKDEWRAALLPKAYNGSRRWEYKSSALGISSQTKHPELAFELVKFLARPEFTKHLIKMGDSIPLRTSGEEMSLFLDEKDRPPGENEVYLKMLNDKDAYSRIDVFSDFVPLGRQMQEMQYGYERYMMAGSGLTAEQTVRQIAVRLDYLRGQYVAFRELRDQALEKEKEDQ